MNKQDRKELHESLSHLDEARSVIENIKESEQDKFDNLSEGLQQSENGQKLSDNVDELDNIINNIDDVMLQIDDIINN